MTPSSFRPAALTAALVVLFVTACGGATGDDAGGGSPGGGGGGATGMVTITPGGDPNPGPPDVEATNFRFEPETFTVAAGVEVQWVNTGTAPHTVTGEGFDSGVIRPGNGYRLAFDEPGTYEYWCSNHPSMTGTVVVE